MLKTGRLGKAVAILLTLTLGNFAHAQDKDEGFTWFGQKADGEWMAGIKMSSIQNGRGGYDNASNIGLVLGYQFSRVIGNEGRSSIEFEMSNSFDNGNVSQNAGFGANGDWSKDNLGLYFTYRGTGSVYFMGKLGFLKSEVMTNLDGMARFTEQDTAFSYGMGVGLHLGKEGNFNLEAEFIGATGTNDMNAISIGGVYLFP